jgi:DNA-binding MarR family transcriptional regulator
MIDSKKPLSPARAKELRHAIELFYFGYRAFTEGPDRILAQKGLNRVHHRILYFVGRNPDIHVTGLLETLAVSKQALNAPLRQLLEMKLVEDRPSEEDKRVKKLRLTRAGEVLEGKLTETQMRWLDAHLGDAGAQAKWFAVMRGLVGEN